MQKVRGFCSVKKGVDERIDEVLSVGLDILEEWRIIGLLKGYEKHLGNYLLC